jgi:uncharacterized protein (DUF488 family)
MQENTIRVGSTMGQIHAMRPEKGSGEPDYYMIGYEKLKLENLFALLKDAGVRCLVDVRSSPRSRVPYYNKNVLVERLDELGSAHDYHIKYISIPALGNPPENRKGHCGSSEAIAYYRDHITTQGQALDELHDIIKRCRTALMCYEADPACCHRSELAAVMKERYGLTFRDLRAQGKPGVQYRQTTL